MANLYTWEKVDQYDTRSKGTYRIRVNKVYVDGKLQPGSVDVIEKRRTTFSRGDRVVIYQGMGDYALGVFVSAKPSVNMVLVKFDGYTDPDGVRNEPYDMWVDVKYVEKDTSGSAAESYHQGMLPGYEPIPATL